MFRISSSHAIFVRCLGGGAALAGRPENDLSSASVFVSNCVLNTVQKQLFKDLLSSSFLSSSVGP